MKLRSCPFLEESPAQYCSAVAVTKFIPCSEAPFFRCSNENHRYCEHYLARNYPDRSGLDGLSAADQEGDRGKIHHVGGIPIPSWLSFSANHMWIDINCDGFCHVGVDAFLTRLLGDVERISLLNAPGVRNPTAVVTAREIDLQIVFPNRVRITRVNMYLRRHPEKLMLNPYSWGWLFEGIAPAPLQAAELRCGMINGDNAIQWMKKELYRISQFTSGQGCDTVWDATGNEEGWGNQLLQHLNREEILHLFNEFFAPHAGWSN